MTARLLLVSEPLPECLLCEQPTRRAVYDANGGLCTGCEAGVRRAAELLPTPHPERRS